ncbi:X8 domain-containing protein [Cephalotus follicularis]|uniref:X8 domain-containing protein n=1 Tax=Cephalotus follicularis TaxID=3775 RepID=A0A1Q3DIT4_CEPFO|nr:X8 domain-containing protein [Cephalotus follicularis]
MAALVLLLLFLAITTGQSSATTWCVCKDGADTSLQKTLDYACGAGADCGPIHQNGPCYNPNTVKAHCSYAVNSYFQRKGQAQGSCDFAGTATVTATDPSITGCAYPSSASTAGTGTTPTPVTATPGTTTTTPTTSTTTSPYTATPSSGVLGGIGTGLGPTGAGINTDMSDGGFGIQYSFLSFFALLFQGLVLYWG